MLVPLLFSNSDHLESDVDSHYSDKSFSQSFKHLKVAKI